MSDNPRNPLRTDHAADAYMCGEPPDLGPLRAVAEQAEIADAVSRLADGYGLSLSADDPLAPLARDVARALVEAGFTLHHCARHHPLYRLGGVCLLPVATAMTRMQGRDRGVLDNSRSALARVGSLERVSRRTRGHERRARPGA
jgi:hypothetical protein